MQQRLNLGWQKNLKHVPSSRVVTKTRNDLKWPKTTAATEEALRSNCGLSCIFLTDKTFWFLKWYMPPVCLRPWWHYTTLLATAVKLTTWGFWAKKKTPKGAYALFCHADFILACRTKFLILFFMIRSVIQSVIQSVIPSVIQSTNSSHFRSF